MSVQLERCAVALDALEHGHPGAESDARIALRCLTLEELSTVGDLCGTVARICQETRDRRAASEAATGTSDVADQPPLLDFEAILNNPAAVVRSEPRSYPYPLVNLLDPLGHSCSKCGAGDATWLPFFQARVCRECVAAYRRGHNLELPPRGEVSH